MAIAMWLVVPLGSITWLGSLKSHPGALPTSGKASGPNSPRQGCWLASGSSAQVSTPRAPPSRWRASSVTRPGGWDAVKRPWRLANMAANLDLPGDSALEVEGASGQCPEGAAAFPDLLPPLAESPLDPFVVEGDFREACWLPIASMHPGRGRHSENREVLCYTLSGRILGKQDEGLTRWHKIDRSHIFCRLLRCVRRRSLGLRHT